MQSTNLRKALQGDVAELLRRQEARTERLNERCLENIAEGDPVAETQKGFEGRLDQAGLISSLEDLLAEAEDLGKFSTHGLLQASCLGRGHLLSRIIKDFFGKQTQDNHVVLANRQARVAGRDDFVDKRGPVVRPFLLEDGDEHQVELVEQCLVIAQGLFTVGALDDELHNEVADAW